jgi:tetratricopeptide (TPR) repeat protein
MLSLKHVGAVAVAVLYVAISLAEGGFSIRLQAALAVVAWWVVVLGLLVRAWPGWPLPRAAVLAGGALLGLAALSGLSMLWADDAGRAFAATMQVLAYLGVFVLVLLASRRGSATGWLTGLAVGIGAVALIGLASRVEPGLFGSADLSLAAELPAATGRLSYPVGYWNALAAILAMGIGLFAWATAAARSRALRAIASAAIGVATLGIYLAQSRGGGLAAAAAVAVLVVMLVERRTSLLAGSACGFAAGGALIVLAKSRDAFLAGAPPGAAEDQGVEMVLAVAVICLLAAGLRWALDGPLARLDSTVGRVSRRRIAAGLVGVVALTAAGAAASGSLDSFDDPGAYEGGPVTEGRLTSLESSGRSQFWSAGIDAFAERPVVGIGAGNYELYWNAHSSIPAAIEHAHSLFLEQLAELGIAGLVAVLAFFAVAAAAGVERARAWPTGEVPAALAVLAAGAVSAALEWTWEVPAAFLPAVVAAAVLTGAASVPVGAPSSAAKPAGFRQRLGAASGPRERFGLRVGLAVAGVVAIWVGGVVFLTEAQIEASQDAVARGQLDDAADDAEAASNVQPWSPEPYLQLAQVEELRGDEAAAQAAVGSAIERAPGDWRVWLVAARVNLIKPDLDAAREAFERAAARSPLPLESPLPLPSERVESFGGPPSERP